MGLINSRHSFRPESGSTAVHHHHHHQRQQVRHHEDRISGGTVGTLVLVPPDRNVNNAHNRYSNTDINVEYPISASTFLYVKPASSCDEVRILKMKVGIDNKSITTDETSRSVIKYKTPHFRAFATVEVPKLNAHGKVEVGWIQVCHKMQCANSYGQEGLTSWEFPEITLGKYEMVSDSDGKSYPWYGTKHEVQTVDGPTDQSTTVTVHMHDNFFPQVTWYIPAKGYPREPRLTHIYRKQRFYTCLAVRQEDRSGGSRRTKASSSVKVLHAVEWTMEVDIEIDPTLPLEYRTRSVGPPCQEEVTILDGDENIDSLLKSYALEPPNANNSQALVWRPFDESTAVAKTCVVVKPKQTTVAMDAYVQKTRDYGKKLLNAWTTMTSL